MSCCSWYEHFTKCGLLASKIGNISETNLRYRKYFLAIGFFNKVWGIVTPCWMSAWQSFFHLFLSFLDFFDFLILFPELPFENPKLLIYVSESWFSLSDSSCFVANLWVNAKKSIKFSFPNIRSSELKAPQWGSIVRLYKSSEFLTQPSNFLLTW